MPQDYSLPQELQATHHRVAELSCELPPAMLGELLQVIAEHAAIHDELVICPPNDYTYQFRVAAPNPPEEDEN